MVVKQAVESGVVSYKYFESFSTWNGGKIKRTCIMENLYQSRLKSSWTGGSAPLLCRGRR
jgi:hypothetical protein